MLAKPVLALLALCAVGSPARADEPAPASLPSFVVNPQPTPSIWSGFHVGSEVFAISRKGSKGLIGGGVTAGYDHEFANNFVIGIDASTGFAPYSLLHSPLKGYDYAATNVKLGYDMGRLMPYLTAGVVLARPNAGSGAGYVSAADSASNLFNSSSNLRAAGSVGAGFDYAVTDRLKMGLGVSVGTGRGLIAP